MSGSRVLTTLSEELQDSKCKFIRDLKSNEWFYRAPEDKLDEKIKQYKLKTQEKSTITFEQIENSTAQFVPATDETDSHLKLDFTRPIFIKGHHFKDENEPELLDDFLSKYLKDKKDPLKKHWDQHIYYIHKSILDSALLPNNYIPVTNYKANIIQDRAENLFIESLLFEGSVNKQEQAQKKGVRGKASLIYGWLIPGTIFTRCQLILNTAQKDGFKLTTIAPSNALLEEFCEHEQVILTEEKIRQAQKEEIAALKAKLNQTNDPHFQEVGKKVLELIVQLNTTKVRFNTENADEKASFEKIKYLYDVVSITRQLIENPSNQTLLLAFEELGKKTYHSGGLANFITNCAAQLQDYQKARESLLLISDESQLSKSMEAKIVSALYDIDNAQSIVSVYELTQAIESIKSGITQIDTDSEQNKLIWKKISRCSYEKQIADIAKLEKLLSQSEDEKLKDFGKTFLDVVKIYQKKKDENAQEAIALFKALGSINQLVANPFDQNALENLRQHVNVINTIPQIKAAIDSHISAWEECQKAYIQLKQVISETNPATPENKNLIIEPKLQTQAQRVLEEAVKLKSTLAVSDLTQLMNDTRKLATEPLQTYDAITPRYKKQADKLSHHSKLKTAMGTLAFMVGAAVMVASASAIIATLGISTPFSFLGFTLGAGLIGLASWLGVSTTVAMGVSAVAGTLGFTSAAAGGVTFFKNVTKTKLAEEMDTLLEMKHDHGDDDFTPETPETPSSNPKK